MPRMAPILLDRCSGKAPPLDLGPHEYQNLALHQIGIITPKYDVEHLQIRHQFS